MLAVLCLGTLGAVAGAMAGCGEPSPHPPAVSGDAAPTEASAASEAPEAAPPQEPPELETAQEAQESAVRPIPEPLRPCAGCHFAVLQAYLGHGMADSLGAVDDPSRLPAPGEVTEPRTGTRYRIDRRGGEAWLTAVRRDGGVRRQRVVGRVGAGVFDVSWVTEEVDGWTGEPTGRLFFAPVESVTGHGLVLSPFELHEGSPGLDMALTQDCLTCHTTDRVFDLPEAAVAPNRRSVYPANALGSDALRQLRPVGCDGCHGDTTRHAAVATGASPPRPGEGLGIGLLRDLPPGALRDVCSRCHLQGEARLELTPGPPDRARPLAGQIPVLVPAQPVEAFRFVGQMEQLARSRCFEGSPEMTCVTCHDPHTAVAAQGTASFDAACIRCHEHCPRPPELTIEEVTGRPARSEAGCVDCHLPRDQPLDLPHIETTDHHIRRRLPPRRGAQPHRALLAPDGPLAVYDDGRLAAALATPAGRRWRSGVLAMGLVSMGRLAEAAELFAAFPPPGTPEARRPTAPEALTPLETAPLFHHLRALVLQATGRFEAALSAYGDALELDPHLAGARLGRARLRLDTGDLEGLVEDTEVVLAAHPGAEAPWNLRAELALRLGRLDMAEKAFTASAKAWPGNAAVWYQLAQVRRLLGLARELPGEPPPRPGAPPQR
jgi:hypothetical protein